VTVAERRKQEREERRHLILDAAERVFYERGLEAATMEDVAAAAELGKGTLYLYFRNKDDLRWAMAARRQEALLAVMSRAHDGAESGLDELRQLLRAYAEQIATPIEHLQMILSCWVTGVGLHDDLPAENEHRGFVRQTFRMFCGAIERGRADGTIRPGRGAPRTALQLWSAVNGALLLQLQIAHMSRVAPLSELSEELQPPTLSDAVEAILDGVRSHGPAAGEDVEADSTPEPPVVVESEDSDSAPPIAAAGGDGDEEGGVQC
jgi:AcrR family transcriptional regulator